MERRRNADNMTRSNRLASAFILFAGLAMIVVTYWPEERIPSQEAPNTLRRNSTYKPEEVYHEEQAILQESTTSPRWYSVESSSRSRLDIPEPTWMNNSTHYQFSRSSRSSSSQSSVQQRESSSSWSTSKPSVRRRIYNPCNSTIGGTCQK